MEEKKLYPFRLSGITDSYGWGSEKFLLADLGYRDTFVRGGWLSGNGMGELMETYLDRLVGEGIFNWYGLQFPFQLRRIRVNGKMPLRVCPPDELARDRYDHLGKEKFWYVRKAGRDARLLLGFKEDADAGEFYAACLEGNVHGMLNSLQPREGQYFHIPPGTPHCAWGDVEIMEVSESSALDFLLCPWGAVVDGDEFDPAMGIAEALEFIKFEKYPAAYLAGRRLEPRGKDENPLVEKLLRLDQFTVSRIALASALRISSADSDSCLAYTCLQGEFELQPEGQESLRLSAGETVLVPAECDSFTMSPLVQGTLLLETMVEPRAETDPFLLPDDDSLDPAGD